MCAQRWRPVVARSSRTTAGRQTDFRRLDPLRRRSNRRVRSEVEVRRSDDLYDHERALVAVARSLGLRYVRRRRVRAGGGVIFVMRGRSKLAGRRMLMAAAAMGPFALRCRRTLELRFFGGGVERMIVMSAATEDGVPKHGPGRQQAHHSTHRCSIQHEDSLNALYRHCHFETIRRRMGDRLRLRNACIIIIGRFRMPRSEIAAAGRD